jgi:hypothetical protein
VLARRGHESRLVIAADQAGVRRPNAHLVSRVVRGFAARRALIENNLPTDRAAANARRSHLSKLARASYLAPDIVEAILAGNQPPSLGARQIIRTGDMPMCWDEQRRLFGFKADAS